MSPSKRILLLCCLPFIVLIAKDEETIEEEVAEALEMRTSIYEIVETFSSDIAFIIVSESFREEDAESRRRMLAWALRTIPYMRSICYDNSAEISLVDLRITLGWLHTQLNREGADTALNSGTLDLTRQAVGRAHGRIDKVMRERLEPENYARFKKELANWIDRHPEQISLRFGVISDLAIEHMDLDERTNLYDGISQEARILEDLKRSRGGGLFTGKLESSLEQTNIEVQEIELEMQRIADHLEWLPIYLSWMVQLTAIDYVESGPLVEKMGNLNLLPEMIATQQAIAAPLEELVAGATAYEPRVQDALEVIGKMDTHMLRIEQALEAHEHHIARTADALGSISKVLTNRTTLISLALITGAGMGVAFMLCILLYKTFGERRKDED